MIYDQNAKRMNVDFKKNPHRDLLILRKTNRQKKKRGIFTHLKHKAGRSVLTVVVD